MPTRSCQTCRHFEPSAEMRKGWCRNPRLYSPQQSHIVDEDGLDCSRGFGNAWEPAMVDDGTGRQPLRLFGTGPRLAVAGAGGGMMASATGSGSGAGGGAGGSGGGTAGWPPQAGPPRRGPGGPPPGQERTVSYQPEERYWTDYLRIALPVLGLLLMLGLFWFWVNELVNDDDSNVQPTPPVAGTINEENAPTATATAPATVAITPTVGAPGTAPTPTTAAQPSPSPSAVPEGAGPTDAGFAPGVNVVVAGTDGANVRAQGSADATLVGEYDSGTVLQIIGDGVESEGFTWWLIRGPDGNEGYIREDLLELAE